MKSIWPPFRPVVRTFRCFWMCKFASRPPAELGYVRVVNQLVISHIVVRIFNNGRPTAVFYRLKLLSWLGRRSSSSPRLMVQSLARLLYTVHTIQWHLRHWLMPYSAVRHDFQRDWIIGSFSLIVFFCKQVAAQRLQKSNQLAQRRRSYSPDRPVKAHHEESLKSRDSKGSLVIDH